MSQINVIPDQKIQSAAAGNEELRELLQAIANNQNLQTNVTNTGGKNVPVQARANVSFLQANYVVQIQNPGATSPVSSLQASQATAIATVSTTVQAVVAIYHQIRVATSPRFSISDNVQTFGGDTGSTQTYWTLTGLGSGRFYFQIRSSYDGINWNLWRNANGGQTITPGLEGVTTEQRNNSVWAVFAISGSQLMAFGSGFVSDAGTFDVPDSLYTSAMQSIPGPNGFVMNGNLAHGQRINEIDIVTPVPAPPLSVPPDYPTVVFNKYEDGEGNFWSGSANIFTFAYDPLGTNAAVYPTADGVWTVFSLPGGAQMVVASGKGVTTGSTLTVPTEIAGWFSFAHCLSIVTSQVGLSPDHQCHGVHQADISSGGVVTANWEDGEGNIWGQTCNWFLVGLSPEVPFETLTGGEWAKFTIPTGTPVAIGAGVIPSGSSFDMPTGFTSAQSLSIGVPASFNDTGHAMVGVAHCYITGTYANLQYEDGANNFWDGDVAWFCFAWQ